MAGKKGVCSACIAAEAKDKSIDWEQRKKDFYSIIEKFRLNKDQIGYDCLIPVSGGKDSSFQAYFMKKVCGMNPLCVCSSFLRIAEAPLPVLAVYILLAAKITCLPR